MPEPGQDETVRVVALDRSFHIGCYKCEVSLSYAHKKLEKYKLTAYYSSYLPICLSLWLLVTEGWFYDGLLTLC